MKKDNFREAQISLLMQIVSQLSDISCKLDAIADPPKTEKTQEEKPKEDPFKFEFDKNKINETFKKIEGWKVVCNEFSRAFNSKY